MSSEDTTITAHPLWHHGPFRRFVAGATLSYVGTWFNTIAVTVLVARLSHNAVTAIATAVTFSLVPRVILNPVGGVLADRFERRQIMVLLNLFSALVTALPLLVHRSSDLPLVYLSGFFLQVAFSLYSPAENAYMPTVVPGAAILESATSIYSTLTGASLFIGPLIGGLIIVRWGPYVGFVVNSLSFLLAATLLLTLPRVVPSERQSLRPDLVGAGYLKILRAYPQVGAISLINASIGLPIFFFQGTVTAFTAQIGQATAFVGVLYSAVGAGGIVGGFVSLYLASRLSASQRLLLSSTTSLGWILISFVHSSALMSLTLLGISLLEEIGFITVSVYAQRLPSEERGRASGFIYSAMAVGQLAGALLATRATNAGAASSLLVLSVLSALCILASVVAFARLEEAQGRRAFSDPSADL